MKTSLLVRLLLLLVAVLFTSCAHVEPWQRDLLAQKKMQLIPCPLENYLDQHIYMSKEASTGGQGVGGGGCGCN